MAMINCKECNREISSSAKVCPSCAYPIEEKRKEASNNMQLVLITILLLIFLALHKLGVVESFLDDILGGLKVRN